MKHLANTSRVGLLGVMISALTACGGGAGLGSGAGSTVSGVAATGMAIANGQVSLKCAEGQAGPVTTQADGSYSIDVSKVKLPCLARVDYVDASHASKRLHSAVQAAGNVNITPLTDMVVANLSANGIASDAYDKLDENEAKNYTSDRIKTATQSVKSKLQSKGVDITQLPDDVIGDKFTTATSNKKGDSHDRVLDDLQEKLRAQGATLQDLETEMTAGHEGRGLSTSTGSPGNATAGKALYEATCQGCHGTRMPDAVNSARILNAIRENEGGMSKLATTIGVTEADDIATYMANGTSTVNVPALKSQTISFQSPGNQTMGVTPPALAATASSGLAVTVTTDTPAVCSVNGNALVLLAAGTCSLSANQSGNTAYNAAVTVINTFTVASSSGVVPAAQTIAFISPGAQMVGATVTLSASASSGLTVTLASATPKVCTVTGTLLTALASGSCVVTANQSGNASFAAAPMVNLTLSVTSPTVTTSAANGKALYVSNNCGNCHGTPPASLMVLNGANNPTVIQNAITSIGGMNKYSNLSSQNLADIAAYLATPNL